MAERFVAINGEVWDQTTLPARHLTLDEARVMAARWDREAQDCRKRGAYDVVKLWSMPCAQLIAAIDKAMVQREHILGFKERAP